LSNKSIQTERHKQSIKSVQKDEIKSDNKGFFDKLGASIGKALDCCRE
jgi:hypothetical protein